MSDLTLVIGDKNYSSWSLRPWLMLKHSKRSFTEILIRLDTPTTAQQIAQYSPAGKVPVLLAGDLNIWDSLAIAEYLAEAFPEAHLWPQDRAHRALARSVSAEMHAGFAHLRHHMPLDIRGRYPGQGLTTQVQTEIQRIQQVWQACRSQFVAQGPWLFGAYTIADAMYAPVVLRFVTYEVVLDPVSSAYVQTTLADPFLQEWIHSAHSELPRS